MAEEQHQSLLNRGDGPRRRSSSERWFKRRLSIIMLFFGTTSLMTWYFITTGSTLPHSRTPIDESLIVNLPEYGTFQGTQVLMGLTAEVLSRPINAWLGIEYSTQPVGKDRFKPVTWPIAFEGIRDATSYGPVCYQDPHSSSHQSEACLSINIYRPSGISLDEKLPVFVFLHGGAFVFGSARSFDGAQFVAKSTQPLIVVTAQYRLGALGSLPSKLMEEEGLLNLGLRDQRMMLEFVQKYIVQFGGDAEKVTLGGLSAGGHSVGIHLFHNYGEDAGKPLFSQAILASGSETARAFPGAEYPLYQQQFEEFMDYVNCPTSSNSAALECLRGLEVMDIQYIGSAIFSASNYNVTWPFQPVSPGPLFEKRGSKSGQDNTFFKIPVLVSTSNNEGSGFAPQDLRTNAQYLNFWRTLTPGLTDEDLQDLEKLYPDPQTIPQSPYVPQPLKYVSLQFERVSAALADYSYICPVQETADRLSSAGARVYKARFNTPNYAPAYLGVPHASDASYFNGQAGTQYPEIADIYSAYYASFIVSGDPNTYKVNSAPKWETYESLGGRQLVVNPPPEGGPKMENESEGIRMEQCAWWRDEDRAVRLNK